MFIAALRDVQDRDILIKHDLKLVEGFLQFSDLIEFSGLLLVLC